MRINAFYLALMSGILLFSCNSKKDFPLFRVDGLTMDQVQVEGILGEYFHNSNSEVSNSDIEIMDSSAVIGFDISTINQNNIDKSMTQLIQLAELYANSGQEELLDKAENGWNIIKENVTVGSETSSIFNHSFSNESELKDWIQLNSILLKITGAPKYASEIEDLAYNVVLTDKGHFETRSELVPIIYTRYLDEIYVNVFGRSSMQYNHTTGGSVRIVQDTEFPYDGLVKLKFEVDDKRYVDLHIRIPEWAERATVTVGGVKYKAVPGEYAQITKKWKTGDIVEIILPMRPIVIEKQTDSGAWHKYFGLKYGTLNLATSMCDSLFTSNNAFNGKDPYPYLRFVSPPGDVPTFTFDGINDTTLVFQPSFAIRENTDNNCFTTWIPQGN
ncbi:hypothetical protein ACUNWD_02865 [Sunxiuqinia sp. A32]|uniref:hypothetical protein n=1 Tax=Sunxiuqinia sp. A32 TaxID=3461496 RepID=UPI004045F097